MQVLLNFLCYCLDHPINGEETPEVQSSPRPKKESPRYKTGTRQLVSPEIV